MDSALQKLILLSKITELPQVVGPFLYFEIGLCRTPNCIFDSLFLPQIIIDNEHQKRRY